MLKYGRAAAPQFCSSPHRFPPRMGKPGPGRQFRRAGQSGKARDNPAKAGRQSRQKGSRALIGRRAMPGGPNHKILSDPLLALI